MVKVLLDHNMPPPIARAVDVIVSLDGHQCIALRDKFSPDISDVELYTALAKEGGWVVISKDLANARRKPERAAILRSKVIAIYLARSIQKQSIREQAATILWQWDLIVAQRASNENGLFELPIGKRSKFRAL